MSENNQQSAPKHASPQQAASKHVTLQQVPPQESARHHVHHSYIWLGSFRVTGAVLVTLLITVVASLMGKLSDGETVTAPDTTSLLFIAAYVAGGFVLLVGIIAVVQWFSYKHLYYVMEESEFNLYSGVFNKKRVSVPYQRVQSVDQRASFLQRIFGVCSLNIDTAGGSANKAVSVPYVQKEQAEALRTELFARKQYVTAVQKGMDPVQAAAAVASASGVVVGDHSLDAMQQHLDSAGQPLASKQSPHNVLDAPAEIWDDVRGVFGGESVDTGKVTYEYGMSNKELVFTGLTNGAAFMLIVVGILGAIAQFTSQIVPIFAGNVQPLVGNVVGASVKLFGGNFIAAGVAVLLLLALAGWILSIVGTCISYGGFRARRRDNRIEVERGLLQHQFHGVSVDRVQSIIIKQSLIRRLLGYCELSFGKIDATSDGDDSQQKSLSEGLVVHPFVKMDRVPEILAGLAPEFAEVPVESIPLAKVALRRAIIRRATVHGMGFWLAVLIIVSQVCVNTFVDPVAENISFLGYFNMGANVGYVLCVALLVLDIVGAVLWFRGSGFAYNKRFMQVSNGGFSRETVSFPRKKIQFGYVKTNPFQRNARTATVQARTAAGVGGTTIRLVDAREEDARAWLDWVIPRGNMVQ